MFDQNCQRTSLWRLFVEWICTHNSTWRHLGLCCSGNFAKGRHSCQDQFTPGIADLHNRRAVSIYFQQLLITIIKSNLRSPQNFVVSNKYNPRCRTYTEKDTSKNEVKRCIFEFFGKSEVCSGYIQKFQQGSWPFVPPKVGCIPRSRKRLTPRRSGHWKRRRQADTWKATWRHGFAWEIEMKEHANLPAKLVFCKYF